MTLDRGLEVKKRIEFLDGWRGTAILLVLVGHFLPIPGSDAGRAGVELFFLLSGLLMGRLLVEKQVPLGRFIARRVGRVVPALAAFLLGATILQAVLPATFGKLTWLDQLSVASFWSNYRFLHEHPRIFGHTWSLSIEEHSYLFLALVVLLAQRNRRVIIAVLALTVIVAWSMGIFWTAEGRGYHEVYWRTDVRGASILVGLLLYLERNRVLGALRTMPAIVMTCAAVGLPLILLRAVPNPIKYTVGTALTGVFLMCLFSDTNPMRRLFEDSRLRVLGKWSYSLYLVQQIFHVAKNEFPRWTWPIWGAVAVVLGWLGYHFVEAPGQRVVDRVVGRQ